MLQKLNFNPNLLAVADGDSSNEQKIRTYHPYGFPSSDASSAQIREGTSGLMHNMLRHFSGDRVGGSTLGEPFLDGLKGWY